MVQAIPLAGWLAPLRSGRTQSKRRLDSHLREDRRWFWPTIGKEVLQLLREADYSWASSTGPRWQRSAILRDSLL